MAEELVNLTIDSHPLIVPKGTLIVTAAKKLGIEVPIYCYHPKMPPLGACRMCFVEVEKMPKLQTACTTPVAEGMVVRTNTPGVIKARQGTLEFLLINHPLDCPICDKGGECDLQDFTQRHGPANSRFLLNKRHYAKPIAVSDEVLLDRERCILCQRCTRFCAEVAMEEGLVMIQRGAKMEVGTFPDKPFTSQFSGNTIEMCPVGALTSRSYRFKSRPWELKHYSSICPHCSVGCNITVDVRVDKVLRFRSRTNDAIDDGWLCNRGRFGFDFINAEARLRTPLLKQNGVLAPATWDEALNYVAGKLQTIIQQDGPDSVGALGSLRATNEDNYLLQKFMRVVVGTNNVDHRHGAIMEGHKDGLPFSNMATIEDIDKARLIVLAGADPSKNQPVLDLRIKKAIRSGAKLVVLSPESIFFDRFASRVLRYQPGTLSQVLRGVLQSIFSAGTQKQEFIERRTTAGAILQQELAALDLEQLVAQTGVAQAELAELGQAITAATSTIIFMYDERSTLSEGAALPLDLHNLALVSGSVSRTGAGVMPLYIQNNSLGARDMGVLPDFLPGYESVEDDAVRKRFEQGWAATLPPVRGQSYTEMVTASGPKALKALYVLGDDPASEGQTAGLLDLQLLVVQELFLTETAKLADVVLPAASFAEKEGTVTSLDGHVQAIRPALKPQPGTRLDTAILGLLAHKMGTTLGVDAPRDVLAEMSRVIALYRGITGSKIGSQGIRRPLLANGSTRWSFVPPSAMLNLEKASAQASSGRRS